MDEQERASAMQHTNRVWFLSRRTHGAIFRVLAVCSPKNEACAYLHSAPLDTYIRFVIKSWLFFHSRYQWEKFPPKPLGKSHTPTKRPRNTFKY